MLVLSRAPRSFATMTTANAIGGGGGGAWVGGSEGAGDSSECSDGKVGEAPVVMMGMTPVVPSRVWSVTVIASLRSGA